MKSKKRDVAGEIMADLKEMHATLKAGASLREKYTVRTIRAAGAEELRRSRRTSHA